MDQAATDRIKELGRELEPHIIALRRKFHEHPEVGGTEYWTSKEICAELDELGVPYRRVADTGIIATIAGTRTVAEGIPAETRTIALRADIDALPVTERTGAPYASKNPGFMHACGHDCHIAMMLGAVRMLVDLRNRFSGEARILFQPAEELSTGSRKMIAAGALEGVDTIYGAHIWSDIDAGLISCEAGKRMANTDWFRIDIHGVSAHGSMPHKGIDAIVVGAEMIESLQVLVSRDVSPFEPAVLTVGEFHGGEARNIMAGSAYLTGTVRTWSDELRAQMPVSIERIAKKIASAFGAEATVRYDQGNGALTNDVKCAKRAQLAVIEALGREALGSYRGTLSGEDFSEYLKHVPGVLVFVGCRNEALGACHPQHSCYYDVDESVLAKGAMVAAQYAIDFLQGR